jgi:fructose-specific phosphotransferase system IIA component
VSIKDLFSRERVCFNLKSSTKAQVIDELIEILNSDDKITDMHAFKKEVLNREEIFSTGIGMGIAIPHGKSATVKKASIVFGKSEKGIDYDSIDEEPAYLFFLIAVPIGADDTHLKALSEISRKLMHSEIRESLKKAEDFEKLITIFD